MNREDIEDHMWDGVEGIIELKDENVRLLTLVKELDKALGGLVAAIDDLVNNSHGVDGLHLNGDIALWDELLPDGRFEGWLSALIPARVALDNTVKQLAKRE